MEGVEKHIDDKDQYMMDCHVYEEDNYLEAISRECHSDSRKEEHIGHKITNVAHCGADGWEEEVRS